jgi:hypothetical protein
MADNEAVSKEMCDVRMKTVILDTKEMKADIKAILENTSLSKTKIELSDQRYDTLEISVQKLWNKFDLHKENHWKWIAIVVLVITLAGLIVEKIKP